MGIFHKNKEDHDKVVSAEGNQAHLSHELIAAAAAYEASKAWGEHQSKASGEERSHAKVKDFLSGAAAAFAVKIAETKGRDYIDKKQAEKAAKEYIDKNYTADLHNTHV